MQTRTGHSLEAVPVTGPIPARGREHAQAAPAPTRRSPSALCAALSGAVDDFARRRYRSLQLRLPPSRPRRGARAVSGEGPRWTTTNRDGWVIDQARDLKKATSPTPPWPIWGGNFIGAETAWTEGHIYERRGSAEANYTARSPISECSRGYAAARAPRGSTSRHRRPVRCGAPAPTPASH